MRFPESPCSAEELIGALVEQMPAGADIVVPIANGEPIALMDQLEANAERLDGVRVHQMHALRDRPYLHGAYRGRLEHVSWFLSHITRPAFLHLPVCTNAKANASVLQICKYFIFTNISKHTKTPRNLLNIWDYTKGLYFMGTWYVACSISTT
jgi:hypothetical protein